MASGLLSGSMTPERVASLPVDDWRSRDARFREPQLSRSLELAERLGRIGQRHQVSAGAVAVAWVLQRPGVDGAIVGFRRSAQTEAILAAASLDLAPEEVEEIEERLLE
jgi:aryl-alcohol dehydrogenase-like predicted oxidoreductase